jgi:hypothetical protein
MPAGVGSTSRAWGNDIESNYTQRICLAYHAEARTEQRDREGVSAVIAKNLPHPGFDKIKGKSPSLRR